MVQHDVFANPSGIAAEGIPYVVVVQSDLLDALATRLAVPLAVLDVTTKVPTALCPPIMVKGQRPPAHRLGARSRRSRVVGRRP